jgi:TRAP-type C4-dicarboxylate transport system permease small subunit
MTRQPDPWPEEEAPPLTGMSDLFDSVLILPSRILCVGAAILLLAMMLVTVGDVTIRTLFHDAIDNAELMTSHWFLTGTIFLPLAYVTVLDRHISVEVVEQFLPVRVQQIKMGVFLVVGVAIFLLLAWQSWVLALQKMQIREFVSGATTFYSWPGRFLMPVGTFMFALVMAARAVGYFSGRVKP